MKMIIVVALALVAAVAAAPVDEKAIVTKVVQILRSQFDQKPEGGYDFAFESEDGIARSENGELKVVNDEENKPHNVVVVRGSYSYTDSEGKPQTVNYYADETGYHAEGDIIPKADVPARR